ncbi:hypothetical protein HanRHA438_Chr16g0755271 [Helianthus annuus]|nr:hypothetical protein HanIR_Chr16g0808121 [Helianthus annuus]KAJ0835443.1 hypothetical protein HanRHA438_Chr16g0755271 [Helianthus annuus]
MCMYIYKDHVGGGMREIMGTKGMEEVEVVMKRFGDEQSTLLDRFERLSFEVQLNQAILGRSFSDPRYQSPTLRLQESTVRHHYHHRGSGFQKVLKKLFKPIFGRKKGERNESTPPDQKNFKFIKAFTRSLRV